MIEAPTIDYEGMSPLFALVGGSLVVLMTALFRGDFVQKVLVPALTVITLAVAAGLTVWIWEPGDTRPIVEGALEVDTLALGVSMIFYVTGIATVFLALRSIAVREVGAGEFFVLMLGSITGMAVLAGASNLVTVFIGLELLSIPLYVLCGTELRRATSLESGIKYLIIGSVGSGTLLYGLALVYGATGATDFSEIRAAIGGEVAITDPLLLAGVAMTATGLAFKASVAPFHQWTPDVYQGAPTPVTTFMAVATKAAAFAIFLRFFDDALPAVQLQWGDALAVLAAVTIVIGNVGAIPQRSLKRMLAWSGVAQAGYLLAGVVVGTQLGLEATVFYLFVYLLMNVAAFAVVIARERVHEAGDDLSALDGLGRASPWLAGCMTIAMLSLAGFPATAGFIGKFRLLEASIDGDYGWLAIMIVLGSVISLAYYLRVVAVMWMTPVDIDLPLPGGGRRRVRPAAGWSPEADARAQPEVMAVAALAAVATVVFGLFPAPLFDVARDMGTSLTTLL